MTSVSDGPGQRDRTFVQELGLRVRAARGAAGLSQSRLERDAGLPAATVTRLERGEQDIAVHELDRIANTLSITLAALIPPGRPATDPPGAGVPSSDEG